MFSLFLSFTAPINMNLYLLIIPMSLWKEGKINTSEQVQIPVWKPKVSESFQGRKD
jgi:hypothetical protein